MNEKIYIDFIGGSHGNFLEFVCNVFIAKIKTANFLPFNSAGASHNKQYLEDTKFVCDHYTTLNNPLHNKKIIQIDISADNLLPLQCISLLRAGDFDIDPELLEINTYHKLDNVHYRWVLDKLISSFFNVDDFIQGYKNIADPGWPSIESIDDYLALPDYIQSECKQVHGFEFNVLDKNNPHCPRHILKEFFEIGFLNTSEHGLMQLQKTNIHTNCKIHKIPFLAFYNQQDFFKEISKIAKFVNIEFDCDFEKFEQLHCEFLARQPYKNVKQECDQIVDMLIQNKLSSLPPVNVIKEAYISARLFSQNKNV